MNFLAAALSSNTYFSSSFSYGSSTTVAVLPGTLTSTATTAAKP